LVTPGVHPGFATHHVRRVRMSYNDPLVEWCRARGYRWEWQRGFDGEESKTTVIIEFPCRFPDHTTTAAQVSAIDQLELQARLQREWADNAVSITVYYRPEELPAIREYLAEHLPTIKSVSFLLHSDHGFDQAPLEEVTQAEYEARVTELREVAFRVDGEMSEMLDSDCASGACPIR
jgi:ribonucleoside-diphosphate reductase alpha chain